MTFDLIRAGWPNTAAILALALMPIVALARGGTVALRPFGLNRLKLRRFA